MNYRSETYIEKTYGIDYMMYINIMFMIKMTEEYSFLWCFHIAWWWRRHSFVYWSRPLGTKYLHDYDDDVHMSNKVVLLVYKYVGDVGGGGGGDNDDCLGFEVVKDDNVGMKYGVENDNNVGMKCGFGWWLCSIK